MQEIFLHFTARRLARLALQLIFLPFILGWTGHKPSCAECMDWFSDSRAWVVVRRDHHAHTQTREFLQTSDVLRISISTKMQCVVRGRFEHFDTMPCGSNYKWHSFRSEQIVEDYTSDTEVQDLLATFSFYFMPVVNPDGYEYTWTDVSAQTSIFVPVSLILIFRNALIFLFLRYLYAYQRSCAAWDTQLFSLCFVIFINFVS